ncbi:MAG TPA: glycosyltransferase family 8 protein [Acidimicrobiales bacterium]
MSSALGDAPIVVAVAIDDQYAPWAATLLRSCIMANPSIALSFEIVHNGTLSEEDRSRLVLSAKSEHSSVRFHTVSGDDLRGLPTTPHFGTVVWMRFFIPDLLLDRTRVIYLDSDTLVMSGLLDLWSVPLDSTSIAAVANVVEPSVRPHVRSMGIEYPGGFFNSGVLVMDLERMRIDRSAEELLKTAFDHRDRLVWPDQDALNLVFRRRWLPLHPRWNAQNSFWAWDEWATDVFGRVPLEEAKIRPAIRHFEGPGLSKPWHYLCPYPGRKHYRAVMAQTPWAGTPLQDKTAATRFVRWFPPEARIQAYIRLDRVRRRLAERNQNRGRQR